MAAPKPIFGIETPSLLGTAETDCNVDSIGSGDGSESPFLWSC